MDYNLIDIANEIAHTFALFIMLWHEHERPDEKSKCFNLTSFTFIHEYIEIDQG